MRCARAERRVHALQEELAREREARRAERDEMRRSTRAELVRVVHTGTALVPVVRPQTRGR